MSGVEYYVVVLLVYFGTDLLATWGLNLEFGVAGVANFAYIVLVAAGAYTYSVLTLGPSSAGGGFQSYVVGVKLPVVAAILIAMAVAAVLGCLIGVTGLRRLRPDYQAMTMFVVSVMATTVVSADTGLVNGNAGLSAIPNPLGSLHGAVQDWAYVAVVLGACIVLYPFVRRFTSGPMGRAFRALRDDEEAAIAVGKNVVVLRVVAQGVGGALAGASGALLAGFIGGWSPSAWQYVETLALLTAIIVGGLGNDAGVLMGTVIVPVLILQGVQFLPHIKGHPQLIEDIGWMLLGAITIVFIWLRPQGVIPERRPGGATGPAAVTPSLSVSGLEDLFVPGPALPRSDGTVGVGGPGGSVPELPASGTLRPTTRPALGGGRSPRLEREILVVRDLDKRFGGVHAVVGTSFEVKA
ncbi:MAG: branched-chain amino acid ABC transporter permease, partial [Acidimicrobiales bacterium]